MGSPFRRAQTRSTAPVTLGTPLGRRTATSGRVVWQALYNEKAAQPMNGVVWQTLLLVF